MIVRSVGLAALVLLGVVSSTYAQGLHTQEFPDGTLRRLDLVILAAPANPAEPTAIVRATLSLSHLAQLLESKAELLARRAVPAQFKVGEYLNFRYSNHRIALRGSSLAAIPATPNSFALTVGGELWVDRERRVFQWEGIKSGLRWRTDGTKNLTSFTVHAVVRIQLADGANVTAQQLLVDAEATRVNGIAHVWPVNGWSYQVPITEKLDQQQFPLISPETAAQWQNAGDYRVGRLVTELSGNELWVTADLSGVARVLPPAPAVIPTVGDLYYQHGEEAPTRVDREAFSYRSVSSRPIFGQPELRFAFPGPAAGLQITSDQLSKMKFVVRVPSGIDPLHYRLMKLDSRNGSRLLQVRPEQLWTSLLPVTVTSIDDDGFTLNVPQSLAAGEYCFTRIELGNAWCFSVRAQ